MKLTTTSIRTLAPPAGLTDKTFFDDDLPGFGVRVRAGGSKTFIVQYKVGSKHRRLPLGTTTTLDLGRARSMAKDVLAAVRLGRDPLGEKLLARAKVGETLGALLPHYLTRQKARLKPRSYQETERHLLFHAKQLHPRAVDAVDRRAVAVLLAKVAETRGPTAANRVRASLSACFAWLAREGLVDANPVIHTNRAAEAGARERTLGDDEIAKIWQAAGDNQYGAIVRLLLLTGARRDEIAALRWSELDLNQALISLPGERTKSRKPHEIPLSASALKILQAQPRRTESDGAPRDLVFGHGQGGFQLWSKSKAALDARIAASGPITHWTLHDFRRTLSTAMHERLGIQPHVVEAVLGHVSGHRGGVAGIYNRSLYRAEKRRALEVWGDHVLAVIEGRKAKVVPLR